MAVINRVTNEPIGNLRHLAPPALCEIIEKATQKNRDQRQQTTAQLYAELNTDMGQHQPAADDSDESPPFTTTDWRHASSPASDSGEADSDDSASGAHGLEAYLIDPEPTVLAGNSAEANIVAGFENGASDVPAYDVPTYGVNDGLDAYAVDSSSQTELAQPSAANASAPVDELDLYSVKPPNNSDELDAYSVDQPYNASGELPNGEYADTSAESSADYSAAAPGYVAPPLDDLAAYDIGAASTQGTDFGAGGDDLSAFSVDPAQGFAAGDQLSAFSVEQAPGLMPQFEPDLAGQTVFAQPINTAKNERSPIAKFAPIVIGAVVFIAFFGLAYIFLSGGTDETPEEVAAPPAKQTTQPQQSSQTPTTRKTLPIGGSNPAERIAAGNGGKELTENPFRNSPSGPVATPKPGTSGGPDDDGGTPATRTTNSTIATTTQPQTTSATTTRPPTTVSTRPPTTQAATTRTTRRPTTTTTRPPTTRPPDKIIERRQVPAGVETVPGEVFCINLTGHESCTQTIYEKVYKKEKRIWLYRTPTYGARRLASTTSKTICVKGCG